MKHHYSTINGIVTTFSDIHQSAQKGESILVYMERAAENGFDTAEILLPSISFVSYSGFSEDERTELLVIITPRVLRSDEDARAVSRELRDRMKGLSLSQPLAGGAPAAD